jgi:excisionase family DNA binding protein
MVSEILKDIEKPIAVDIDQAARLLSSSSKVVRNYIRDGSLVAFKLGRSWTIRIAEIERFVKQQEKLAQLRQPGLNKPRDNSGRFAGSSN